MKRLLLCVAAAVVLGSCASTATRTGELIDRSVRALGGAEALQKIHSVALTGTAHHWAPEQSPAAGGEMRYSGGSRFHTEMDFKTGMARTDWVRNLLYPAKRTYTFSEIIAPDAGYVEGIDTQSRNAQSLQSKPPGHTMSGARLATTQRELLRASPRLIHDMHDNRDQVRPGPDIVVGSDTFPSLHYQAGDHEFLVMFDARSGLPARIRTLDYDNIWGDSTYDLVLSDWRIVNGIHIATRHKYEFNGKLVAENHITGIRINPLLESARMSIPAAARAVASKPERGKVHHQWVLRRGFIGTYYDSDNPSYDTRAAAGPEMIEIGAGLQHIRGARHNSLLVEMQDYLIVFDAPITDWMSNWTLDAAKQRYPGKPVKYLILTHHHMDHAGGVRAYAAAGATIVVGPGNGSHFRRVFAAPFTGNPDLAPRDLSSTPVVEVAGHYTLSDGRRQVSAHVVGKNYHAEGMLIGYVADAQLGFVTDLWSPGRGRLPEKINPLLAAVVDTVNNAGLQPLRFAGGHGTVADYAPLAALAVK